MQQAQKVKTAGIVVVLILLAIWLGLGVVTNQLETLAKVGGGALLVVAAFLGRRVWILALFLMSLKVPIIRGFGTDELGMTLLIGFCILLLMIRRLPLHLRFDEFDVLRLAIAACIIQVYLRHPVGLGLFGASGVGARPYFEAGLSLVAGFALSKLKIEPQELKWAAGASVVGGLLSGPGTYMMHRGAGVMVTSGSVGEIAGMGGGAASRSEYVRQPAVYLARWVSSKISPLRAAFHPLWVPVILLSFAFAALSGYRNTVAMVGLIYLAGIIFRGGFFSFFISVLGGVLLLALLAFVNVISPLPPNIQRALSPFPGTWDQKYVEDAELSTEWRVEMWEEALLTDLWIENKVFGDGLGMSRLEVQRLQALSNFTNFQARGGLTYQQEEMMVTGAYHSGPVQTIRTVGYVGLAVLLIVMVRMAVLACRLIKQSRGTEWFPVTLFFGIQVVVYPIFFTFVFGQFGQATSFVFISSGLLSLMRNNLPLSQPQRTAVEEKGAGPVRGLDAGRAIPVGLSR